MNVEHIIHGSIENKGWRAHAAGWLVIYYELVEGILDFRVSILYNNYEKRCKHNYFRSRGTTWKSNEISIWIG